MSEPAQTLVLRSPRDNVDLVHGFLERLWVAHADIGELDRMAFETALIELVSNVIEHADTGHGVTCVIGVTVSATTLVANLSDTADAGEIQVVGRLMPSVAAESGRGIALVQMLVDDLQYERVGEKNLWSMSRNRVE
ncbi:serine/threonine-protein kinase RsbW [Glaciihabitans tibetensis]|uniref:Serine/threonine-protein kinase RsbW n=1 Tax=Glaciihabitans tibetensis TaxID=1266600 RepID=A0A2T0VDA5_9MICO|nr:ATP-binding protein [Glaciihabitans tibetensis]PRY68143.1 serine/threonine-protein kinase RsbW [Glaciihabitans tibetensis]